MAIDKEAIKEHIRGILVALGDDPDREGLKETPDRVARMYEEVFEGMNYTNDEIAEMFGKTFKEEDAAHTSDMVFVKDIEVFSYCEHPTWQGLRTQQNRTDRRHGSEAVAASGADRIRYRICGWKGSRLTGCSRTDRGKS